MTEPELKQLLTTITPPSETARAAAHAHWAEVAQNEHGKEWADGCKRIILGEANG